MNVTKCFINLEQNWYKKSIIICIIYIELAKLAKMLWLKKIGNIFKIVTVDSFIFKYF